MSHEAVKKVIADALAKTRSPKLRRGLQDALDSFNRVTSRPHVVEPLILTPELETAQDRAREELRAAEIQKYGKPFPHALDRVTLKSDSVTPQRPGWWVGWSNEEKNEIHIWKPVYSGGGAYPTLEDGYGVVNKIVKVEDVASVY